MHPLGMLIVDNNGNTALRHACATHMLENGASIRALQKLLGHASLRITQVYTHVAVDDLRMVLSKYHPRG